MNSEMRGSLDARGAVAVPLLTDAGDWTSLFEPNGGGELPAI
jgi:hypothetical protein